MWPAAGKRAAARPGRWARCRSRPRRRRRCRRHPPPPPAALLCWWSSGSLRAGGSAIISRRHGQRGSSSSPLVPCGGAPEHEAGSRGAAARRLLLRLTKGHHRAQAPQAAVACEEVEGEALPQLWRPKAKGDRCSPGAAGARAGAAQAKAPPAASGAAEPANNARLYEASGRIEHMRKAGTPASGIAGCNGEAAHTPGSMPRSGAEAPSHPPAAQLELKRLLRQPGVLGVVQAPRVVCTRGSGEGPQLGDGEGHPVQQSRPAAETAGHGWPRRTRPSPPHPAAPSPRATGGRQRQQAPGSPEVSTARWASLSGCHPTCSTRRPGRLAKSSASSTTASHRSCRAAPPLAGEPGAGRQLARSMTTTRLISGSSRALPATAAYVPERLRPQWAAVSSSGGLAVMVRRLGGGAVPAAPPCRVPGAAASGTRLSCMLLTAGQARPLHTVPTAA